MKAVRGRRQRHAGLPPVTLVWIDAQEAIIVGNVADPQVGWLHSDVPVHRKSVGHVRFRPGIRHGGGMGQDAAEHDRAEHLRAFVGRVVDALAGAPEVLVLGPGQVGGQLARTLRTAGIRVGRELAPRLTIPQLIERMRAVNGHPSPRLGIRAAAAP